MTRRAKGDGALFERQMHDKNCPPAVAVVQPDGRTKKVRPAHKCKTMWVGVLQLPSVDGKSRQRYVYGKTQTRARTKLNEERRKLERFGDIPTSTTTVEKWLAYWIEEIASSKVKPTTLPTYRTAVKFHIVPFIGKHRLDQLNIAHLRAWHRALAKADKVANRGNVEKAGYSFATIISAHAVLSSALTDAQREGRLHQNVAKLWRPKGTTVARTHLSTDEARTMLSAVVDDRLGSRWTFAMVTGTRQGERLGLRWDAVDLDAGVAHLSWQLQRVTYSHGCGRHDGDGAWPCGKKRPGSCPQRFLDIPPGWEHEPLNGALGLMRPKGREPRLIPLIPSAVAALRARHDAYLAERKNYTTDHGLVWCHEDGRPIDRREDYTLWQDALAAAGLPSIALHGLRHTTASLLDELGVQEGDVQRILGHSRITTTRGYTHQDISKARAALVKLGQALELEP